MMNVDVLFDTSLKRDIFDHMYRLQVRGEVDVCDREDIQRAILEYTSGWMWAWNAYLLAAEFYGESANYSQSDIKMLRRLSM
jgi:hypothetical protein